MLCTDAASPGWAEVCIPVIVIPKLVDLINLVRQAFDSSESQGGQALSVVLLGKGHVCVPPQLELS